MNRQPAPGGALQLVSESRSSTTPLPQSGERAIKRPPPPLPVRAKASPPPLPESGPPTISFEDPLLAAPKEMAITFPTSEEISNEAPKRLLTRQNPPRPAAIVEREIQEMYNILETKAANLLETQKESILTAFQAELESGLEKLKKFLHDPVELAKQQELLIKQFAESAAAKIEKHVKDGMDHVNRDTTRAITAIEHWCGEGMKLKVEVVELRTKLAQTEEAATKRITGISANANLEIQKAIDQANLAEEIAKKAQTRKRERVLDAAANFSAELRKWFDRLITLAVIGIIGWVLLALASRFLGVKNVSDLFGSNDTPTVNAASPQDAVTAKMVAPVDLKSVAPASTGKTEPKVLQAPKQLEFPPVSDEHDAFDEAIAARAVQPLTAPTSGVESGCVSALKTGITQTDGLYIRETKGKRWSCKTLSEGAPESKTSKICDCTWSQL